jgi:D-alanine-D-alanine ligase
VTTHTPTHVIVLFGGESAEHDVSCVTAAHVLRALDPTKYHISAIGITRDGKWNLATQAMADLKRGPEHIGEKLSTEGESTSISVVVGESRGDARTVVFPLLHGPLGEDGTVQGLLELANIAFVGTGVLGSAVSMDKGVAKQVLHAHRIPQPQYLSLREAHVNDASLKHAIDTLGLPLFVKPANMGSSVGVSKAKNAAELKAAAAQALKYDEWIVIEEAISGREIEVAVLGNIDARASTPGEIVPGNEFYDYEDKYITDGAQLVISADLSADEIEAVQKLAIVNFHTLRAEGMARVDFFYEKDGRGFLCNEINTIPGFTPISMYPKLWQASGLSYRELLDELIALAIDRHSRRRRNTAR